jgi:hypothetical protein
MVKTTNQKIFIVFLVISVDAPGFRASFFCFDRPNPAQTYLSSGLRGTV